MSNGSSITEFLLLTLTVRRELQLWHFWLFLGIPLAALLGNGLIITAIACDHRLHTPIDIWWPRRATTTCNEAETATWQGRDSGSATSPKRAAGRRERRRSPAELRAVGTCVVRT
ncbi:olfactory receptor 14I1-like isoform X2 [Strix aluco]|uniref:olfactory receptor 14I1-like isoform X2 n=1 Tax=Strix aluco TaxID=111821 RepID=UPI003DA69D31